MATNKVVFGNDTLIDLTGDTVNPQSLALGATAHNASGVQITGTADYGIASSAEGTSITLTDSADAMVQGMTVKGHSEAVSGEIVSVGDNGLTVTTSDSGNTATTSASFTTAFPLRSVSESIYDELTVTQSGGEVITRCEVVNDEVVALATPVVTPLTSAELAQFRQLRTFDSTTNITMTDDPACSVDYLRSTDNGKAVARVQAGLQEQISASGAYTETVLYSDIELTDEQGNGSELTLSDDPLNYDAVVIEWGYVSQQYFVQCVPYVLPRTAIYAHENTTFGSTTSNYGIVLGVGFSGRYVIVGFTGSKITIVTGSGANRITRIAGIRY